jgi:hypothetical protein
VPEVCGAGVAAAAVVVAAVAVAAPAVEAVPGEAVAVAVPVAEAVPAGEAVAEAVTGTPEAVPLAVDADVVPEADAGTLSATVTDGDGAFSFASPPQAPARIITSARTVALPANTFIRPSVAHAPEPAANET